MVYDVITFDVWGHDPQDCAEHRCSRCVSATETDGDDIVTHDDNRCDCHYEINEERNAGKLEYDPATDIYADNTVGSFYHGLWRAMRDQGFARGPFEQARFEEIGECDFTIYDDKTDMPVFGLRAAED